MNKEKNLIDQRASLRVDTRETQQQRYRRSEFDTNDKQATASIADPESLLFYSPHRQVDTAALDEYNAAKDGDRQVGDCDQSPELCGTDLPEAIRPVCCQPA